MTTFILSRQGEKGRVILDEEAHGPVLETVSADAVTRNEMRDGENVTVIVTSAWQIARAKVNESKFAHFENEGWFPIKVKVAA